MISTETTNFLAHQLRKLAQSGLPGGERADLLQQLLEQERASKMPADETQKDFLLPLFRRGRAHLSLV